MSKQRLSDGLPEMVERRRNTKGRIQHRVKVFNKGGRKRVSRYSPGADMHYARRDFGEVIDVRPRWKRNGPLYSLDEHRMVTAFDPRTLHTAIRSRETGATLLHWIRSVRGVDLVEGDRGAVIEAIRANRRTEDARVRVNDIVPGVDCWVAFLGGPQPHVQFDGLPAEYTWETVAQGTWFANGDPEGHDNSAGEPPGRRLMEVDRTVELEEDLADGSVRTVVTDRCTGRVRTRDEQHRYHWTDDPVTPIRMH